MSDYLARLVERSLGAVPQIEPLIAPLHAPPEQSLSAKAEPEATIRKVSRPSDESAEADVAHGETPLAEMANARTAAGAATPREKTIAPPAELLPQSPVARRAESFNAKTPATPMPARAEPESPSPQPSRPVSLPGAEAISIPAAPKISVREERIRVDLPARNTVNAPIAEPVSGPMPRADGIAASTRPPELPAPPARTGQPPNRVVVQPEVSTVRPAHGSPPIFPQQSRTSEPPAVHVTIGRVEVRAIMASPESPRRPVPPPVPPKISLQEYLKQGKGARS